MKTFDITIPVVEAGFDELTPQQQQLVTLARKATYRSYAPYSKFSVGAAILLSNGEIVTGSNQENAAYPSGLCAERTAAFYAHATYPEACFTSIAIAARGTDGNELPDPISPCGACRQALLEYEKLAGGPVEVMLAGKNRIMIFPSVSSTLPYCFSEF
ncbi:cytidine deaminase [uncultured Duncaniella sp.]|jgi:cytidine deaminase|uniref:cytidine deaminase n=1 Tax=uncultured Duncaniella sp. TaxID=2768039 RepID=UPI0025AFAF06|nr:cytidine deaminase [uncultured Duncaniella sp.]